MISFLIISQKIHIFSFVGEDDVGDEREEHVRDGAEEKNFRNRK